MGKARERSGSGEMMQKQYSYKNSQKPYYQWLFSTQNNKRNNNDRIFKHVLIFIYSDSSVFLT